MKKILIPALFFFITAFGTLVFAQQAPITTGSLVSINKTGVDDCLRLFEQLSTKQAGKATAYRLIGTRTGETNQLIDTQRIWYSYEFGSKPIPPMIASNFLTARHGYTGTLFDSIVKFVPDPQNPGQVEPQEMSGYSFNGDLLPSSYYYWFLGDFTRSIYTYNGAKKLLIADEEINSGGNWISTNREVHSYIGNTELVVGLKWNGNTTTWDSAFKKYIWYDANSLVDSTYRANYSNGTWVLYDGEAYDYNSNGQIIRFARYNYDAGNMVLKPLDLEIISYNAGGDIALLEYHTGTPLNLYGRNIYHYSGNVLDSIGTDFWDVGASTWNDWALMIFSYNGGLLTKKENFNYSNGTTVPNNKLEFTSDANQNISYSGFFIWNSSNQSYTTGVKHYYTYEAYQKSGVSVMDVEQDRIMIYPNPSSGLFHMEIPFEGSGSYEVISMDGKEVFRKNISSMDERLQRVDLNLNSGVYFILLKDLSGRSYSGKMAIE